MHTAATLCQRAIINNNYIMQPTRLISASSWAMQSTAASHSALRPANCRIMPCSGAEEWEKGSAGCWLADGAVGGKGPLERLAPSRLVPLATHAWQLT